MKGINLKDLKHMEPGILLRDPYEDLPVFITSYLENEKCKFGFPQFEDVDQQFMSLNGRDFEREENPILLNTNT